MAVQSLDHAFLFVYDKFSLSTSILKLCQRQEDIWLINKGVAIGRILHLITMVVHFGNHFFCVIDIRFNYAYNEISGWLRVV